MKIYTPVKDATGTWCGVRFQNGVGETNNPRLIKWFREHGYDLEGDEPTTEVKPSNLIISPSNDVIEKHDDEVDHGKVDLDSMNPNELREWMKANGYGREIKNIRDKEKLLKIIRG